MISRMRFALVSNVACANEVLSIGISPSLRIAAAIWIAARISAVANSRVECLKFAIERLLEHYPKWELWLITGHRTVQPDNRLTRHFGLWKSLARRGNDMPTGDFIEETFVPCEGGIRFFGGVKFAPQEVDRVCGILTAEGGAIVALDGAHGRNFLKELVGRGWAQKNTKPPEEILESVCPAGGLVIDLFGEFDDSEIAAAVMGKEELVARLDN